MKKLFNHFNIVLVLLFSVSLFFNCFGDDEKDEEQPAYMSQAHVLIVNTQSSTKSINSIVLDSGSNWLTSPLPPDYYCHLWDIVEAVGLDVTITDEDSNVMAVNNQNISIGQVLYIEYNGTTSLYSIVGNMADYAYIIGLKSADVNIPSTGVSVQSFHEEIDDF